MSAELSRSGSQYRIASLFEHAIESTTTASCPALWRFLLHYFLSQNDHANAEKIFIRAVHSCPWNKLLWLEGLADVEMNEQQRKELRLVMIEKEIRIRQQIPEH